MNGEFGPVSLRTHELPESVLNELRAGPISPEAMKILSTTQESVRRLCMSALFGIFPHAPLREIWETLASAEEAQRDKFRDVLHHPPGGVWLAHALRHEASIGYMRGWAAAAAAQTGLSTEVQIPVSDGIAHLPTVGRVMAPGASSVVIHTASYGTNAHAPLIPVARERYTSNGFTLNIYLEDCDQYREFSAPVRPHPIGVVAETAFLQLLRKAWDLLTSRHTAFAKELSAGLRMITPLAPGRDVIGSSSRPSFGGIAIRSQSSVAGLAEGLIHEMQHVKINAVLDLLPLTHQDSEVWAVPWRAEPRPLVGVLHGVYAFTGVVEFWSSERAHGPDSHRLAAQYAFNYRKKQVSQAIEMVKSASALTEQGRQLIDAARERILKCERLNYSA